jgi:Ca2+-binding EF-hand superfamily protein
MGASSSLDLRPEEVSDIMEETLYEPKEIKSLYRRFRRLDRKGRGTLSVDDLAMIPEVIMNPLHRRLIAMFECDKEGSIVRREGVYATRSLTRLIILTHARRNKTHHHDAEFPVIRKGIERVQRVRKSGDEESWCVALRSAREPRKGPRNPLPNRPAVMPPLPRAVLFRVFDVDGDGQISPQDLRAVLELLVGKPPAILSEAAIEEIICQTIRDSDADKDGVISLDDFSKNVAAFCAWDTFTVPVRRAAREEYFLEEGRGADDSFLVSRGGAAPAGHS